jgi:hypothetical protein
VVLPPLVLAMTILVRFWVVYWATPPPTRTLRLRPNLRHYTAA